MARALEMLLFGRELEGAMAGRQSFGWVPAHLICKPERDAAIVLICERDSLASEVKLKLAPKRDIGW